MASNYDHDPFPLCSFGDEVRKSSEKRDALLSKVAELER